jgi:murein DD-endopeptidase MepM/ murein hydrolase activator NlpD
MLADVLFAMNATDDHGIVDVVLNISSMGDIFDAAQQLSQVNEAMKSSLEATKLTQRDLEERQIDHENTAAALVAVQQELLQKTAALDSRKRAKEVLASATQDSENEYRTLMSEIRSEQQDIVNQVAQLQDEVQRKLDASGDVLLGETAFSWPVHHARVTTLFHDPTFPFTHIVGPHAGMDLAVPQGTAIETAAPGYVARVYKGQDYGYYVMIIHANGFATLYAHMSRIDVEVDQYVGRGQVIGLTGGRPGTSGAGFSTGPHLHFEVRLNGIPVNPLAYLDLDQL